jgi:hypothetical protein
MQSVTKTCLFWAVAAVMCAPVPARADGYVTPWVGLIATSQSDDGHSAFGVTAGYMGAGVFGFEADFGYSPDFFGSTALGNQTAITVFGNAILGIPIGGEHGGGVRPFVSGGLGLVRTHFEEGAIVNVSRTNNRFAYDIGGGMMGFFNDHFGLRGEVRYLRTLEDTDRRSGIDFDAGRLRWWRVSGGVTFR